MALFELPSGEIDIKRVVQERPDYDQMRREDPSLTILDKPDLEAVAKYIKESNGMRKAIIPTCLNVNPYFIK
jgi:hypothetical protein